MNAVAKAEVSKQGASTQAAARLMRPGATCWWLALLFLCSCATQKPGRSRPLAEARLNDEAGRGGLVYLKLRVADGDAVPFVVDTGAAATCFDSSLEPKLGKRLGTGASWNFGTRGEAGAYRAPKLSLGGTELKMTGPYVFSIDFTKTKLLMHPAIRAVLGMDVLEHYCLQLDFGAKKLRLFEAGTLRTNGLGHPFALTNIGDGCLAIDENLAGTKGPGSLVDTGYNQDGWLLPDVFEQWTNRAAARAEGAVRSPYGILGGERYSELDLDGLEPKLVATEDSHIHYNGLGLHFLSRHLVTFDFPNRTLYLKRTGTDPLADPKLLAKAKVLGKSALKYLRGLKRKGELPGWAREDRLAVDRVNFNVRFPGTVRLDDFRKRGDTSIYHYELTRSSDAGSWKLEKAWRTDPDGNVLEDYRVPDGR